MNDFEENDYDQVLNDVVGELQNSNKPFVIVLNTKNSSVTLYPYNDMEFIISLA